MCLSPLTFSSLTSSPFSPTHLSPSLSSHLAQNPFIFDCNLKWLADYLRSNPIETSGARCASPRRLANKRIGQIKSKKFRCSGRPAGSESPSPNVLLLISLSGSLSLSLYLYFSDRLFCFYSTCLSAAALLLPSPFLSAGSGYYLCIYSLYLIPHLMSDHSWQKVFFFHPAYHLPRRCSSINTPPPPR